MSLVKIDHEGKWSKKDSCWIAVVVLRRSLFPCLHLMKHQDQVKKISHKTAFSVASVSIFVREEDFSKYGMLMSSLG